MVVSEAEDPEKEDVSVYNCLKYQIPLKSGEINVYAENDIRIRDENGHEKKLEKGEKVGYKKDHLKKKNIFLKYVLPSLSMVVVPIIVALI